MIYENMDQLKKGCEFILTYDGRDVRVLNESRFREKLIDDLIFDEYPAACCGDGQETVLRKAAYFACIW